jgi:hypothetical protein
MGYFLCPFNFGWCMVSDGVSIVFFRVQGSEFNPDLPPRLEEETPGAWGLLEGHWREAAVLKVSSTSTPALLLYYLSMNECSG